MFWNCFDQVHDPECRASNRPEGPDSVGELGVPSHAPVLHKRGSDTHSERRARLQDHRRELRVGCDSKRHREPTDAVRFPCRHAG
jgi:hypothetical protein